MTEGLGIHKAICAIKLALAGGGGIAKGNKAPMGYMFRGIEDFDRILCGLSAEHHIAGPYPRILSKEIRHGVTAKGSYQAHVFLEVEWTYVCETDGSKHIASTMGEAMDTQDKACNKAMQAARKYADILVFRIPVAGDDTEIYVPEPAAPTRMVPAPMSAPAPAPAPQADPMAAQIANGAVLPVAGPGPAKATRAKKADAAPPPTPPPQPTIVLDEPPPFADAVDTGPPSDALLGRIGTVNTFPLLYAIATEAEQVREEPARGELFTAIRHRAVLLFADAPNVATVKEGYPLVTALGQPDELKRAANAAYARFRT